MPIETYQCGGCGKKKTEHRFSKTTVRKYKEHKIPLPRCFDCSGAPAHELKCSYCHVVRSLDQYSGVMRSNPDNAACWDCSQTIQDIEPEHSDQVQEEIAIERFRTGAALSSTGFGSTAITQNGSSRTMGVSNNHSASTDFDGSNDWINPQIPIPEDPRAGTGHGLNRSQSPSNDSNATYVSNASAVTGTAWDKFERTNAPYREQMATGRRISNSSSSRGGSNSGFARQRAVKPDLHTKAQNAYARQQRIESEQAEQAKLHENSDDDDDSDSEPPY